MERIYINSSRRIKMVSTLFRRYLLNDIDWSDRLIAIVGMRGSGKTTLMLQYIKDKGFSANEALYVSLDDIWFTRNSLVEFGESFLARGGKFLFIDEVHKYPTWSVEIKNLYDNFPELHIVFTGSSMLEIYKGQGDLSRRLSLYQLHELSFREYLLFEQNIELPVLSFSDILSQHADIAFEVAQKIKPIAHFSSFLSHGSLPFYKENQQKYHERVKATINTTLESDLPAITEISYAQILKIKKLLMIIAGSVPFKPNITQLSAKIETERRTTYKYLDILERAGLINQLSVEGSGLKVLAKADKIYLGNPNLCHALCDEYPQVGNLRETFFMNQVKATQSIHYTEPADFLVNQQYTFEVGGKNKSSSQIKGTADSYLALDDIEIGSGRKIPLWLFGMMY